MATTSFNWAVTDSPSTLSHLDLTTVVKEDRMFFHLTGTNYMEPITDEGLLETVAVWNQSTLAENADVYRAEYLAYQMLRDRSWQSEMGASDASGKALAAGMATDENRRLAPSRSQSPDGSDITVTAESLLPLVQTFMATRHTEGYVKGVHDHDASIILAALLEMESSLGALRYPAAARALATLAWQHTVATEPALAQKLTAQLTARVAMQRAFGSHARRRRLTPDSPERELANRPALAAGCAPVAELVGRPTPRDHRGIRHHYAPL